MEMEVKKSGTTTVGLVCNDGVILAAEKKSTLGYLVASKESNKIFPIDDHIALTVAGTWGDGIALVRYMKAELRLFKMQNRRRITVLGAATLLSNILYSGRWTFLPYMVQIIIAGYDEKPRIFSLDAIGGLEEERKFFSAGSGSPIALGVLEDSYKEDLSVEKGREVAIRAIRSAIERDIASGGKAIDVCTVTKNKLLIETYSL